MVRTAGHRERCLINSVRNVTLLSENIQIDTHNPDVTTSKKGNSPCLPLGSASQEGPIVTGGCPSGALLGPLIRPCSSHLLLLTTAENRHF